MENEVFQAVKDLKGIQEQKSERLEKKVDAVRDLVQALALKIAEELSELRVEHRFAKSALDAMAEVGEHRASIKILKWAVGLQWPLIGVLLWKIFALSEEVTQALAAIPATP